jgi:hypothetical protein
MCMVGFKGVIRGSSPPRAMASVTVMFAMYSENATISGTTSGPHTTSTRACAGTCEGPAGAAVGTVESGDAAIRGVAESGSATRCGGVRYAPGKGGHQVGSWTPNLSKICSKYATAKRTGGDSMRRNQFVKRTMKYQKTWPRGDPHNELQDEYGWTNDPHYSEPLRRQR